MKIVVYKAIFRPATDTSYDPLYPPECPPEDGVEYVLFRDVPEPREEKGWTVLPQRFTDPDFRRRSRHHKCRPDLLFPDADWTLWLDGSLTPRVSPRRIVEQHQRDRIVTFDRVQRRCAYLEGERMALKGRDSAEIIAAQLKRYEAEGYPRNHGLCATTSVLRRNCPEISLLNTNWWSEIKNGSNRDQVSINYVLWKLGLRWGRFTGRWNNSVLFTWRPHYHEPSR